MLVSANVQQDAFEVFRDRLYEYPIDSNFKVNQPSTTTNPIQSTIIVSQFIDRLVGALGGDLKQIFSTYRILDIIDARKLEFLRQPSTRLLYIIDRFSEARAIVSNLKFSPYGLIASYSFSGRGSYTIEDRPYIGARQLRYLSRVILVLLVVNISKEEKQDFYIKGRLQKLVSTISMYLLALGIGSELVLLNDNTVLYAQIPLKNSLQDGGIFQRKRQFLSILRYLKTLREKNNQATSVRTDRRYLTQEAIISL